jgi:hypothetical protein
MPVDGVRTDMRDAKRESVKGVVLVTKTMASN